MFHRRVATTTSTALLLPKRSRVRAFAIDATLFALPWGACPHSAHFSPSLYSASKLGFASRTNGAFCAEKCNGKEPSLLQLVLQKGTSILQVGVRWRLGNIIVDFQHDMEFNTRATVQTDAPRLTDLPWLRLQSPWYK
jgi:hypothetical protein